MRFAQAHSDDVAQGLALGREWRAREAQAAHDAAATRDMATAMAASEARVLHAQNTMEDAATPAWEAAGGTVRRPQWAPRTAQAARAARDTRDVAAARTAQPRRAHATQGPRVAQAAPRTATQANEQAGHRGADQLWYDASGGAEGVPVAVDTRRVRPTPHVPRPIQPSLYAHAHLCKRGSQPPLA